MECHTTPLQEQAVSGILERDDEEVSQGGNRMFTASSISKAAEPAAQASRVVSLGGMVCWSF
jgi:hypothetical protein